MKKVPFLTQGLRILISRVDKSFYCADKKIKNEKPPLSVIVFLIYFKGK